MHNASNSGLQSNSVLLWMIKQQRNTVVLVNTEVICLKAYFIVLQSIIPLAYLQKIISQIIMLKLVSLLPLPHLQPSNCFEVLNCCFLIVWTDVTLTPVTAV